MKNLVFTRHALQRMRERGIDQDDIRYILMNGKVRIARDGKMDCFVYESWLHVIFDRTNNGIVVVTVYFAYENRMFTNRGVK